MILGSGPLAICREAGNPGADSDLFSHWCSTLEFSELLLTHAGLNEVRIRPLLCLEIRGEEEIAVKFREPVLTAPPSQLSALLCIVLGFGLVELLPASAVLGEWVCQEYVLPMSFRRPLLWGYHPRCPFMFQSVLGGWKSSPAHKPLGWIVA